VNLRLVRNTSYRTSDTCIHTWAAVFQHLVDIDVYSEDAVARFLGATVEASISYSGPIP